MLAIVSVLATLAAFIPLLGFINWLNIPFALLAVIVCVLGIIFAKGRKLGIAGAVLCIIPIMVGVLRITSSNLFAY